VDQASTLPSPERFSCVVHSIK